MCPNFPNLSLTSTISLASPCPPNESSTPTLFPCYTSYTFASSAANVAFAWNSRGVSAV